MFPKLPSSTINYRFPEFWRNGSAILQEILKHPHNKKTHGLSSVLSMEQREFGES